MVFFFLTEKTVREAPTVKLWSFSLAWSNICYAIGYVDCFIYTNHLTNYSQLLLHIFRHFTLFNPDSWVVLCSWISKVADCCFRRKWERWKILRYSLQVLRGFQTDITAEVNEIKRSVASSRRRTTIRFADIKQKRYSVPLMVGGLLLITLCLHILCSIFGLLAWFLDRNWSPRAAATKWCQWHPILCCKYLQSCW